MRLEALRLVVPPHSVVVDRTAAWLWGVEILDTLEDESVPIDVFNLRGHTRLDRPGLRTGQRDLAPHDVVTVEGVRVTTPLRTLLDLGCSKGRYEALAIMDQVARLHGIRPEEARHELRRFRGRRGVRQARQLVSVLDASAESTGESMTRLAIVEGGLPLPEGQIWVCDGARPRYRLDLGYRRYKIAVEYDGEEFHSSDAQRARDVRRRRWLAEQGWIVIVVTKRDLTGVRREAWLEQLRAALRSRTALAS